MRRWTFISEARFNEISANAPSKLFREDEDDLRLGIFRTAEVGTVLSQTGEELELPACAGIAFLTEPVAEAWCYFAKDVKTFLGGQVVEVKTGTALFLVPHNFKG